MKDKEKLINEAENGGRVAFNKSTLPLRKECFL